ncbi:hypothetical protein LHJ74_09060 [Streptomyces sp. N2-109]|uniref:DUF4232 domain-containing protein n=1 Tax=Streptomyces gossypii TaxID=2883101 RepID=A0ABT2JQS6_9ACTN|nr:hypothetical protein [Streptomyces gossypii]MCT2590058.1 hypothetical protein [Streptomyces gossypii]
MGSLRNPIGPLPSTIYWRRRVIALSVLALLALLIVWAMSLGGDGGDQRAEAGRKDDNNGQGPTDAITPGPSDSSPRVSQRPGGRDEADGGAGSGGGDSDGADGGAGDADGGGDGESGGTGGGDRGGALGGTGGNVTGGGGTPGGPGLPSCGSGVTVTLTSVENDYAPGENPKLELTVKNSGDSDCRINLGRVATVLTISDGEGERIWSSADCPPDRSSAFVEVPANGETVQDLKWNRKQSKPECAKAPSGSPKPDTYLAEVKVKGLPAAEASFVLTKD